MQKQEPISNQTQIFRHDARGCFVEAKCDRFHLDRVHLQFVAYDKNRPQGQRYTNNMNIYIPIPEFLVLYQEAASGVLHGRMQQYKTTGQQESLYEHMGGTPASTLARLGKARPDGKSVSRVTKLVAGSRSDYLFVADSGPGDQNEQGLIVPRFGKNPEQHVAVSFSWKKLNEFLFTIHAHYMAWLSARYHAEWAQLMRLSKDKEQNSRPDAAQAGTGTAQNRTSGAAGPRQPTPPPQPAPPPQQPVGLGSMYGSINGRNSADDMRIF